MSMLREQLGTRKVITIHNETRIITQAVNGVSKNVEKSWMYWELGPFEFMSYKTVAKAGLAIGKGLVELGLVKEDRVVIYAETSCESRTEAR